MTLAEQYRPTQLAELVGQPADEVRAILDGRESPNLLLIGPPGTGKTTTARCVARELHGSTEPLYELNASDDRGIDTVRDTIQRVAHNVTLSGEPPVVFLDECDSMTRTAQQALRRPMENAPAVFILAANDREPIHDAVRSRCVTFEYGAVDRTAIETRLREVAQDLGADGVNVGEIASDANGDMRRALNLLERRTRFSGRNGRQTDAEAVQEYI